MQRLTESNYKRPKSTWQDRLTQDQIDQYMVNYVKFNSFEDVSLSTHLRYYIKEDGERKFRLGGNLINKNNADKYVVLSNGKFTWSVDTQKSEFFKLESIDDVKREYENKISKMERKMEKKMNDLKGEMESSEKEYHSKIKKYKLVIQKLRKENE